MLPIGKPDIRVNFKKADSRNKKFAFMKASELNSMEKFNNIECSWCKGKGCTVCKGYGHMYTKVAWRVGKNTSQQLIVETDTHDSGNLKSLVSNLETLFGYKFNIAKTKHGYHIIGSFKYLTLGQWDNANCQVLKNTITLHDYQDYKSKVLELDTQLRNQLYSSDYKKLFTDAMKFNGLLDCVGEFDVLYTVLSLKYGKSTLRISKKSKDDKYEEVKL